MQEINTRDSAIEAALEKARLGKIAAEKFAGYNEEQIDSIIRNMVKVAEENAYFLGLLAHEETGFGTAMDKAYKNHMASYLLYEEIKDRKTIGIINHDADKKIIEVAHPVGLIMGIVPSTNPTATIIYNSIIALKSGNAIVFSPHPSAIKCGLETAKLMAEAAVEAGAPENIISILDQVSLGATKALMECNEVQLIIATGGPGMVKSAYSSGKPAIGVGAGNSPAYIEKTANVHDAVSKIVVSKIFDYGTICASEQSIVCEESNFDEVVRELEAQGGYFMSPDEIEKVANVIFNPGTHTMSAKFVGRSAKYIAEAAGINVPEKTKVLIGPQGGVGEKYPLSYEKLTSVLGFYVVKDYKEACNVCMELLNNGLGHTLSIHTEDPDIVLKFSVKPASRIIINSGGATGGAGLTTNIGIAFTLGCGTCGGSSVSENVGPQHLINIKKIGFGVKDPLTVIQNDEKFQRDIVDKIGSPRNNKEVKVVCCEETCTESCTEVNSRNTYCNISENRAVKNVNGLKNKDFVTDEQIAKIIQKVVADMSNEKYQA